MKKQTFKSTPKKPTARASSALLSVVVGAKVPASHKRAIEAIAKSEGVSAAEIGRRALDGFLKGERLKTNQLTPQEIRADAYEVIANLAKDAGMSPDAFIAAAGGYTLVAVPTKTVRRFREVEEAADLEAGAILTSLVEYGEGWWGDNYTELASHMEGFQIADEKQTFANLDALRARWKREDARTAPAPDRERLTFDVCRETAVALRKLATARKATVESVAQGALIEEASKAVLSAADFKKIGKAVGRAEKGERFDDSDIKLSPRTAREATKLAKSRGMTLSELTEDVIYINYKKHIAQKHRDFRRGIKTARALRKKASK